VALILRHALNPDYQVRFDQCHASDWAWLTPIKMHQLQSALVGDNLIKIVASFSSKPMIVCINYDHHNRVQFNLCAFNKHNLGMCL